MTEDELINCYIEFGRKDISFEDYKDRYQQAKNLQDMGFPIGGEYNSETCKVTNWTLIESVNNWFEHFIKERKQ